jgi:hypothetical protein
MIQFNDGVNINTDGEYRIIKLKDGLYVVGHGFLCPCNSQEEAESILADLKSGRK